MHMAKEKWRAAAWGAAAALLLMAAIALGSRHLAHFDAALVAYTFATIFALFGLVYRYVMWLQRPPTAMYFRRGWQVFLQPRFLARNLAVWCQRLALTFVFNRFIYRRGAAGGERTG